jgi:hypothetical protein
MTKGRCADEFKKRSDQAGHQAGLHSGRCREAIMDFREKPLPMGQSACPNATDRYEAELQEVRRESLHMKAEFSRA